MVHFSSPPEDKAGKAEGTSYKRQTISELVATKSAPAATKNQQHFDPKCWTTKKTAQRHLHGGFYGKYSTMQLQTAWQGERREGEGEGREVSCSQSLQTLCNMWHWNLLVLVPKILNTVRKQHPFFTRKCGLWEKIINCFKNAYDWLFSNSVK